MRQSRRQTAAAVAVALGVLLTAACTSTPTTTGEPTSAQTSTTASTQASTSSAATSSSLPATTTTQTTTTPGSTTPTELEWPATFTPEQATDSAAALAAYRGFFAFYDKAMENPGADWSVEAAKWSSDPIKGDVLAYLATTAERGQYATGSAIVEPVVSEAVPALVSLTACVDSTNSGLFDASGTSIKAPDAPGTYFRHVSKVDVAQFEGGAWLVTAVTDDYSTTC